MTTTLHPDRLVDTTSNQAPPPASRTVRPADLVGLRAMLEQQRAFRVDQLAQLRRPGPPGPLSSADPEVFRSLSQGARAALFDVQSALWRMDDGTYGACVSCGRPLEARRLEILPQVAHCVPCQRAVGAAASTEPASGAS